MTSWELLYEGRRVEVEASTWLEAMGQALSAAGQDPSILTRLQIDVQSGNRVFIKDIKENRSFVLQPTPETEEFPETDDLFAIPPDLMYEDKDTEVVPRPAPAAPPSPPPRTRAESTSWKNSPPTPPTPSPARSPATTSPSARSPSAARPPVPRPRATSGAWISAGRRRSR